MFQTLLSNEALSFIRTNECTVLDVRSPAEFANGHLSMALNVPIESIPQHLTELPQDKTYVIYCEHGSRSKLAANFLNSRGYENIYHVQGGFAELNSLA